MSRNLMRNLVPALFAPDLMGDLRGGGSSTCLHVLLSATTRFSDGPLNYCSEKRPVLSLC
eukprot:9911815-Heterocapsa_arctica.AAC.1